MTSCSLHCSPAPDIRGTGSASRQAGHDDWIDPDLVDEVLGAGDLRARIAALPALEGRQDQYEIRPASY